MFQKRLQQKAALATGGPRLDRFPRQSRNHHHGTESGDWNQHFSSLKGRDTEQTNHDEERGQGKEIEGTPSASQNLDCIRQQESDEYGPGRRRCAEKPTAEYRGGSGGVCEHPGYRGVGRSRGNHELVSGAGGGNAEEYDPTRNLITADVVLQQFRRTVARDLQRSWPEGGPQLGTGHNRYIGLYRPRSSEREGGDGKPLGLFGGCEGAHDAVGANLAVGVGGDVRTAKYIEREKPRALAIECGCEDAVLIPQCGGQRPIHLFAGGFREDQTQHHRPGAEVDKRFHNPGKPMPRPWQRSESGHGLIVNQNRGDL
jgi:hypothetical protein